MNPDEWLYAISSATKLPKLTQLPPAGGRLQAHALLYNAHPRRLTRELNAIKFEGPLCRKGRSQETWRPLGCRPRVIALNCHESV